MNNPVFWTDPTGMSIEPPGDYYGKNGNWLGKDKYNDNKVYLADAVTKGKDGLVTSAKNIQTLSVSHSEFRQQAATVYAESSAYKMNSVTDELQKEMYSIASVHQKNELAYGANSSKASEYLGLTPSQINKSSFKMTANAAVINAITGGIDYSNGATMWDGKEQGLFPESNNNRSVEYKGRSFELHMNTMGWNISDGHFKTWKGNIGKDFIAPQQKAAPANFGNYKNKGRIRLQSTAVYGETIFWRQK